MIQSVFTSVRGLLSSSTEAERGLTTGPNSFGNRCLNDLVSGEVEFPYSIPISSKRDKDLGADVIAAMNLYRKARDEWRQEDTENLSGCRNGGLMVSSIPGSGFLPYKYAEPPEHVMNPTVDLLVDSEKLDGRNGGPEPNQGVAALLSYPLLDRGTILLSNRAKIDGFRQVPRDVAKMAGTLVNFDMADPSDHFFQAFHTTVPAMDEFNVELVMTRQMNDEEFWFDENQMMFWKDSEVDPIPENPTTYPFTLLPAQLEDADIQSSGVAVDPQFASGLDKGHMVVLQKLNMDWVDELKKSDYWLQDRVDSQEGPFAERWNALSEKHYPGEDPSETLRRFRQQYLGRDL